MYKKKIRRLIKLFLCLIIFIGVIVSVFYYRTYTRKVLDMSVEKITIFKSVSYSNGAMNEQQKKIVDDNPEDYRIVEYTLKIENKSDNIRVNNLSIQPEFSGKMKNIIFWLDLTDSLEDNVHVDPNFTGKYGRTVIIKSKGLTDDELIDVAKNVKFKLTYNTFKGNSILSFLNYSHNSQEFNYKEK